MYQDLGALPRKDEIRKMHEVDVLMFKIIAKVVEDNGIELKKSSSFRLQTFFAKATIANDNSIAVFFFQVIGIKKKKKIDLVSAMSLANKVDSVYET